MKSLLNVLSPRYRCSILARVAAIAAGEVLHVGDAPLGFVTGAACACPVRGSPSAHAAKTSNGRAREVSTPRRPLAGAIHSARYRPTPNSVSGVPASGPGTGAIFKIARTVGATFAR